MATPGVFLCARGAIIKNKGAAGADGIGVTKFKDHLKQHWLTIKARLLGRDIERILHGVQRWSICFSWGGDKSSQKRDIKRAMEMVRDLDKA